MQHLATMQAAFSGLLLLAGCGLTVAAVQLRVGLYNEIPDLQRDKLATYKSMVETSFNTSEHTVEAVVDTTTYSPYSSNLREYLNNFDLIEIDTVSLATIKGSLMDIREITGMPEDTLPAAKNAVKLDGKYYGYPTLLCGNFLIGLSPTSPVLCPLRSGRSDFHHFQFATTLCEFTMDFFHPNYKRLYGGKMNDDDGWYLPFLYLDGYIDVHGEDTVAQAKQDVLAGKVDRQVCENLQWLISRCSADGRNKCYQDFDGSYVNKKENVYTDIKDQKTMHFFGYSEKIGEVKKLAKVSPYAAISWPLGDSTHMLQFTDALVVSKKLWSSAGEDKKNAIREFIKFFTGFNLRRKIALGEDLDPPQNRYLLQATEEFYTKVSHDHPLYSEFYSELQTAVAAPVLSDAEKKNMQQILQTKCVYIPPKPEGPQVGMSRVKTEL